MTQKSQPPLPGQGGSYVRNKDGSLKLNEMPQPAADATQAPETTHTEIAVKER